MRCFYRAQRPPRDEGCDSHTKGVSRPRNDRANITHVWGVRYTEPKYFAIPPERVAHLVRCRIWTPSREDGRHLPKACDTPDRDTPIVHSCLCPIGDTRVPDRFAHGPVGGIATRTRTRRVATVGDTVPDSATVAGPPLRDTLADRVARGRCRVARQARADLARHGRHLGRARRAGSTPPRPALAALNLPAGAPGRARVCPTHPDFAVALLRRAAGRAGRRAGQPPYTARELRHVLADSGAASLLVAEPRRGAGWSSGVRADLPELGARTRATARRRPAPAAGRRRRRPRGAALHLGHRGAAEGRDAHPPRAGGQPRAARRGSSRRWSAPTTSLLLALPLFHAYGLNSGPRRGRLPRRDRGAGRPVRPGRRARPDRPARASPAWSACRRCIPAWSLLPDAGRGDGDGADRGLRRGAAGPGRPRPGSPPATGTSGLRRVRADRDRAGASPPRWPVPVPKAGSIGRPLPGCRAAAGRADGGEVSGGRSASRSRTLTSST